MAAPIDQKEEAVVLEKFKGLRNDAAPESFGPGDLVSAVNVEIDNAEHLRRRRGYGGAVQAGQFEWLWTDGQRAYAVHGGVELVELSADLTTHTDLRTDLTPGLRLVYTTPAAGYVYYSNGAQNGAIIRGAPRTWGLAVPSSPGLATRIGGSLPPGRYGYSLTYVRSSGQESGTPLRGVVETSAGEGFKLTELPASLDPDVIAKKVYVTAPNGETLYWVGTLPADQAEFLYVAQLPHESTCQTEHLAPPPPASELTSYNGMILVATDRAVRISEPYQWELFDLRKGFNTATRPVLLAAMNDGVYLGTEEYIAWLPGDRPERMQFQQVADYGVIPGTSIMTQAELVGGEKGPAVVFASKRGICVGLDGGVVKNVTRGRFSYPVQDRGAAVARFIRGVPQFVVTLQGTEEPSPEVYVAT